MCGILGACGNFDKERFQKALEKLRHRGPDHSGIYEGENLLLGHTRLSIIDPHPEAHQPFITDDFALVFNGEIYNYRELIKRFDLKCTTKSDTEVIIRLYEKIGIDCLDAFNGMFAFALYDKKNRELLLARDRFGKKPLYFYAPNLSGLGKYSKEDKSSLRSEPLCHNFQVHSFLFSSEIKAILSLLDAKPPLNLQALHEYLAYLAPLPPNTFFEGIHKLESGHFAVYDLDSKRFMIRRYYDLIEASNAVKEEKSIEELLLESINLRLVADVEVASLLSGGIDSTLLSALYAKISDKKITTFSIGYEEHKRYDELEFARLAAKSIGSNHHETVLKKSEFLDAIPQVIAHLDEPLGDSACIPVYFLSKAVHDAGYKVVLSGEGSDEIFLGYDRYFEILKAGMEKEYGGFIEVFDPSELAKLLRRPASVQRFESLKARSNDSKLLSAIDLSQWIPEVLMTKVDRMSMAWSLESRAPFLDHRLVEHLLALPDAIKIGSTTKSLLKNIAAKYIPREIVERQKKGFSSPYFEWYFGSQKAQILPLFARVNKKLALFNEDYLKLLYNQGEKNQNRQQLWSLIVFCLWFENYYEKV